MKAKFLLVGGAVLALPKSSLVCSDRVFWKEQTEEGSGESLWWTSGEWGFVFFLLG